MIAAEPHFENVDDPAEASEGVPDVRLNAVQERVASVPLGRHHVVLGAPGTGKTTAIRELVARRIREFGPGAALVISPTRKAATALRDPLALQVGVPTHGPLARTAGSVAFEIVRGAHTARGESPVLLTGGEYDAILRELLEMSATERDGWPEKLGPEVRRLRAFRQELRNLYQVADEFALTEETLESLGREHDKPEWVAAARLLSRYLDVREQYLREALDASTVLSEATYLVGQGEAGAAFSNLRTIVLDDAQDATPGVLKLLNTFAAQGVSIVVSGDPDAATAGFRSGVASLASAPEDEAPLLAGAERLVLPTVYRQREKLRSQLAVVTRRIGTARAGSQRDARSFDVECPDEALGLTTDRREGSAAAIQNERGTFGGNSASEAAASPSSSADTPTTEERALIAGSIALPSRAAETAFIARVLREKHLLEGVPWRDLAVVARDGGTVTALARDLATSLVPVTVQGGMDVRDEPAARALTTLAGLAVDLGRLDSDAVCDLLEGPLFSLDAVGMRRLRIRVMRHALPGSQSEGDSGAAGGTETSGAALPGETVDEVLVRLVRGSEWEPRTVEERVLSRLAGALERSRSVAAAGGSIEEMLWAAWRASGVEKAWVEQSAGQGSTADAANRHLDAVVALFEAAKRYVERHPDGSPGGFLAEWLESELPSDTLSPRARFDSVTVTTPAGILGAEFSLVIVAGVQEGVWPNLRVRGSLLGAERLREVIRGIDSSHADRRREVLSDELRMLYSALGKARDRVILTAVRNEDTAPSAAHSLFAPLPDMAIIRRPLTLRGLTSVLRRDLTRSLASGRGAREETAASAIARLAAANVPGANPEEWYGIRERSTTAPLVDLTGEDAVVRVSPSQVERFETCPLSWFLSQHSGYEGSAAASIGTLVHEAFESAEPGMTADEIWPIVETGFRAVETESDWQREKLLRSARELVEGLARYLADFARKPDARFLSKEQRFQHDLPLGDAAVRMSGSIDAIEQYTGADGRPHYAIVDLKTGKNEKTGAEEIARNPQLNSYQLAAAGGDVAGLDAESGEVSDGAKLVIVYPTSKAPFREAQQAPLDAATQSEFETRIRDIATRMAACQFDAMIGTHCYDDYSFGDCASHLVKPVSA